MGRTIPLNFHISIWKINKSEIGHFDCTFSKLHFIRSLRSAHICIHSIHQTLFPFTCGHYLQPLTRLVYFRSAEAIPEYNYHIPMTFVCSLLLRRHLLLGHWDSHWLTGWRADSKRTHPTPGGLAAEKRRRNTTNSNWPKIINSPSSQQAMVPIYETSKWHAKSANKKTPLCAVHLISTERQLAKRSTESQLFGSFGLCHDVKCSLLICWSWSADKDV